ncbi:hypothetical protein WJX74_007961 [Apatococcus lobatus]|uniref:Thioredoxin domain-containing protein n=2 Tax=Apatococcus TaxID=904362 RepID=A0AAW1T3I6_9CHLO
MIFIHLQRSSGHKAILELARPVSVGKKLIMSGTMSMPCQGSSRSCQLSLFNSSRRLCQPARPARRSQACRAEAKDQLQEMEQYRQGLSKALQDKENNLKAEAKQGISRVSEESTALPDIKKEQFYPLLEEAGDTLVIVDFYTDWCGPCKVMLPELEKMAQEKGEKAKFVKFNCNAHNKELGQQLGIRVAPTFQLYKNSKKVAEMTGAKIDELRSLIEKNV